MNLAQLRTLQADAVQTLLNARGPLPTATDQNAQLNWAYRVIARKCVLAIDTPLFLVPAQPTYDLRDLTSVGEKIVRPILIYINKRPLYDAANRDYGLWTYDELARLYPTWKGDNPGTPTKAVFFNWNQLLLHPAPDSAAAGGAHSLFGTYLPADLALDADTPALPEEIHEAIAWLGAQFACTPTISEAEGWQRIQKYGEYWSQIIQEVADQNERTLQSWGSTKGYYEDDLMIS